MATQTKVFVTLKESHVLEIVLAAAAASLNAPSEHIFPPVSRFLFSFEKWPSQRSVSDKVT